MIDILLKRTKGSFTDRFRKTILTQGIALGCAALAPGVSLAGDSTGVAKDSSYIKMAEEHSKTGVSVNSILTYFNKARIVDSNESKIPVPGYGDVGQKELLKNDILVSGTVRFISTYRQMSEAYPDMTTSKRNIAFSDYPLANAAAATTAGFPLLELMISSANPKNFNFAAGYSFTHSMTGNSSRTNGRNLTSMNNGLFFSGDYNNRYFGVKAQVGNIVWHRMSRMTFGQPDYRDNYFERLPWDWYRNSFLRYQEYYSLSSNIGQWNVGRAWVQGGVLSTEIKPIGLNISSIFGRNSMTASSSKASNYPAFTSGTRVEKTIWNRYVMGHAAANYYIRKSQVSLSDRTEDENEIISADFNLKIRKIRFTSEVARGRVNNPLTNNQTGYGVTFKAELDKMVSPIPFSVEYYDISKNVVSLDGGILNSNTTVHQGGYQPVFTDAFAYDAMMFINVVQEVSQITNNRRGLILTAEKNIRKLRVQLGVSMSQEIENLYDTVTIQHRAMAFTRSRFTPWFMQGGAYGRLRSVWRRTYETVSITDNSDYKKAFNGAELLLKYKLRLFNRELVVLNFNNFNSVSKSFSPVPTFSDKAFVRTFYEDLTVAYQLGKKVSIVGNLALERVIGNKFTQLNLEGKAIDQTGKAVGFGIDYDFTSNAGIHLRHTRFDHNDKNFVLDKFKGNETTLELKLFF
ncbi:MAG TPA: hypothetical protein VIK89_15150 [Cytophagaceae bacterium]